MASLKTASPANASAERLVLIPTYNSGPRLIQTVEQTLEYWRPVWVIVDGSTDGSGRMLETRLKDFPGLRVISSAQNKGKGAAVLTGMAEAMSEGYKHALVLDADGQHHPDCIPQFMSASGAEPDAMILGVPIFGPEAPFSRRYGRHIGNWWSQLETLWGGIGDSVFGFRVYPIRESLEVLSKTTRGRRFDFETELGVRLYWHGVRPINIPVPVTYLSREEGGVSHFHLLKDNLLLVRTHVGLVLGALMRLPELFRLRRKTVSKHESTPEKTSNVCQ